MDTTIIEQIQGAIENDSDMQDNFEAYEKIDNLEWELPEGWETKDYIRKRVSTEGHDDLRSLAVMFDTHNPKWEILPRSEADRDRAEELERWLEWHMKRANQIGEKSPFRKALHNAGKYNRVALQVDYLPYWLPKSKKNWSKEQKAAMEAGPFCVEVKNPRNVYYEMGKYGIKWGASITLQYGQAIIDHWSAYESNTKTGKKIKSAISKLNKEMEEDSEAMFVHVDYTSHDSRSVAAFKAQSLEDFENFDSESEHITIVDEENKLDFVNWVIVTGDADPLLHSMHLGGSWENQNLIDTIADSTILMRAFFPHFIHKSVMGTSPMQIDYTGAEPVVEIKQGEDVTPVSPPPLDPGIRELQMSNSSRMAQSAGIKKLQGIEMAGNVQYSTMNAYIQLQMSALEPYKRTTEKAWEQAALLMFKWVKESGDTVVGYRTKVNKAGQWKGAGITVSPEDFEPHDLFISCELIANTPTDKMQLVNMYTTLKQAGAQVSWDELLERLGMGTPEVLKQGFLTEAIEGVALQNMVKELNAKTDLKVQAATMQMQAQLQQQAQAQQAEQQMAMQAQQAALQQAQTPQGAPADMMQAEPGGVSPPPGGDPVMPDGAMNDTSQGGQSTMQSAPGMTRNQVRQ